MNKEKIITNLAIAYFLIGVVVAIFFALYYKWTALSFFSPGFFAVVFSWPLQIIGFISDFLNYGFAGKPL